MYPLGDPPDYEPNAESSIAARAARESRSPEEVAYDLLLERDGKGILYLQVTNYAGGNLDVVREMISAPDSLIGLGSFLQPSLNRFDLGCQIVNQLQPHLALLA